jgi:hypothetical protein
MTKIFALAALGAFITSAIGDMVTTTVALGRGFAEGNPVTLELARVTGTGLLQIMPLTEGFVVVGATLATYNARRGQGQKMTAASLTLLAAFTSIVVVHNFLTMRVTIR